MSTFPGCSAEHLPGLRSKGLSFLHVINYLKSCKVFCFVYLFISHVFLFFLAKEWYAFVTPSSLSSFTIILFIVPSLLTVLGKSPLPEPLSYWTTLDSLFSNLVALLCHPRHTLFFRSHLCFPFWKCLQLSFIIGALKFTKIFHSSHSAIREPFSVEKFCLSKFGNLFFF